MSAINAHDLTDNEKNIFKVNFHPGERLRRHCIINIK